MKKKILGLLIVVFAFTMTIGTGFAAWVITRPVEAQEDAQINVDTVTDESLKMTLAWADNEDYINLVGNGVSVSHPWLTYDGNISENLSITLNVTVTNADQSKVYSGTIYADLDGIDTVLDGLKNKNYITYSIKNGNDALTKVTTQDDPHNGWYSLSTDSNGQASITIEVKWGSYFTVDNATKNPLEFYNAHRADELIRGGATTTDTSDDVTYAADALAVLEDLRQLSTGVASNAQGNTQNSFTFTVYASASDGNLVAVQNG